MQRKLLLALPLLGMALLGNNPAPTELGPNPGPDPSRAKEVTDKHSKIFKSAVSQRDCAFKVYQAMWAYTTDEDRQPYTNAKVHFDPAGGTARVEFKVFGELPTGARRIDGTPTPSGYYTVANTIRCTPQYIKFFADPARP